MMPSWRRKEVVGDCTLYLGDAREIAPALGQVDAIITDPVWPNAPAGMFDIDVTPGELLAQVLAGCAAKRLVVVLRYDSDPRFLSNIPPAFPFLRVCTLPYVFPSYIGRTLSGMEIAYCYGSYIKASPGRHIVPGICAASQPGENKRNGHPCPRPLSHTKWLVNWWSNPKETVLDPFMGSGTTGVACALQGRKFAGIEVVPEYFEIACRRIEAAYHQGDLFRPSPAKPAQLRLDPLL
jgi:site-specific DNA-methyltransferase (adenine-specific)